jgi:hypothetical protein
MKGRHMALNTTGPWELVDTRGKVRARGTYEEVIDEFDSISSAEFQNKTMTDGFTVRRVQTKRRPRKAA